MKRIFLFIGILVLGTTAHVNAKPKSTEFSVFPNPVVNNDISVQSHEEFIKIEILSIVGNVVYTTELEPSNSARLNINLQSGIYLVRITFDTGTSNTKRIWVN